MNTSRQDSREQVHSFATTHWSVIRAAAGSDAPAATDAVRLLCESYWPPVYSFVRRWGNPPAESLVLTQEFFHRLLARHFFTLADPSLGRFRTFLLAALRNFVRKEWRDAHTLERGGGVDFVPLDLATGENSYAAEGADPAAPDELYERRYALALLDTVLARLRQDYIRSGRLALFEQLQGYLCACPLNIARRILKVF